jgi:pimeloyl-ACP methyl ester carboxylesterase
MTQDTLSFVEVGGCRLRLWSSGAGDTPLVYLHGYEGHPGGAPFLVDLAGDRAVAAPEQPGYGASTGRDSIHDIHDLVLAYRDLIGELGFEQVDLVGHSLGGMIAAELAIIAPERVRRLILVNSYGLWLDDEPAPDPFGIPPKDVVTAKWFSGTPGPTGQLEDDELDAVDQQVTRFENLASATKFMWPIPERGLSRRLQYLTTPLLVVHGHADGLVPLSYAHELVESVPGSQLVLIEEAAHYPMLEQPNRFVAVVRSFLDD